MGFWEYLFFYTAVEQIGSNRATRLGIEGGLNKIKFTD